MFKKIKYKNTLNNILYPHIIFASQRQYNVLNDELFTIGPLGAETGSYFRHLFPNMTIIGRLNKISSANVKVNHDDYYLTSISYKLPFLIFDFLKTFYMLYKIIGRCDGVIVRAGGIGTLVAIIALLRNKPLGIEVGGCVFNSLWNYGTIAGKIIAPFSYILRCLLFRFANRVQFVTQYYLQRRYLVNTKKVKTIGISNVLINISSINTLQDRKSRILFDKKVVIGCIGSFNGKFKGFDLAIMACKLLIDKGIDIEFRLLGAGNKEPIQRLIGSLNLNQHVRLYEPLSPGKEVNEWLSYIDIYTQFSRREGISRALIEAMSLCIPVVASNAGGTFELVDKKSIFEIDDYSSACNIIENIISDNEFYKYLCDCSYNNTKPYDKDNLSKKRNDFWKGFPQNIQE